MREARSQNNAGLAMITKVVSGIAKLIQRALLGAGVHGRDMDHWGEAGNQGQDVIFFNHRVKMSFPNEAQRKQLTNTSPLPTVPRPKAHLIPQKGHSNGKRRNT